MAWLVRRFVLPQNLSDNHNFLAVQSNINRRKGTRVIDARLKPDAPEYDPFQVFDYDEDTHRFVVKRTFCASDAEQTALQQQVDEVLEINTDLVVEKRRKEIGHYQQAAEYKVALSPSREFPTAFAFCKNEV